jgi:hypothetical protein
VRGQGSGLRVRESEGSRPASAESEGKGFGLQVEIVGFRVHGLGENILENGSGFGVGYRIRVLGSECGMQAAVHGLFQT